MGAGDLEMEAFEKRRPSLDVCFSYPCWSEDEVAILERRCGAL